jgi:hypothetical protein
MIWGATALLSWNESGRAGDRIPDMIIFPKLENKFVVAELNLDKTAAADDLKSAGRLSILFERASTRMPDRDPTVTSRTSAMFSRP